METLCIDFMFHFLFFLKSFAMFLLPSSSLGHSSHGSPQPSPGILLQQHFALVVLNAFGTEHFPFSKLVKQKLCRVSERKQSHTTVINLTLRMN